MKSQHLVLLEWDQGNSGFHLQVVSKEVEAQVKMEILQWETKRIRKNCNRRIKKEKKKKREEMRKMRAFS